MIVRLIAVGDELLEGRTSDTNSTRVQRALGLAVQGIEVVPDRQDAIVSALARTEPASLVFVYGGLGSTADDLTREAVAGWAGVDLPRDPEVAAQLTKRLEARGWPVRPDILKQACVPRGLEAVVNSVGSAPALVGRLRDRWLAVLPGVPQELEGLLPAVVARLQAAGALPAARETRLWRVAQMAEMAVARLCEPVRQRHPELGWSFWLVDWGVDVRIAAGPGQESGLATAGEDLEAILGDRVFARTLISLPRQVLELARARGQTVAVAESCTGGLLGGALTSEPGSSDVFRGGILAYADTVKHALLGVPEVDLRQAGAVSEPVALAMARGVRARVDADWGLAVTGVAGPGGGTELKPVGTTWIGLAGADLAVAGRYRFLGDRDRNRQLTVAAALDMLRRALVGVPIVDPENLTWGVRP